MIELGGKGVDFIASRRPGADGRFTDRKRRPASRKKELICEGGAGIVSSSD